MLERLQKILAQGGFGSRRECENLILEGRVEVDREVINKLGTKVDPEVQSIRVDGQKLKLAYKKYFAVNKPRGVLSTNRDPEGRPRVIDLIPTDQRVYTVGRLDKDSEGLIIVTNDGELANRLTHPRYGIEKTYLIQVEGHPTREQMESLVTGVYLAEGFVQIKHFQFKRKQKHTTEIEIVLDEGRNREVRRLLAKIGHKVLFLRRIAIGSYVLEGIPFGGHRQLSTEEVESLSINPKRKQAKRKTASRSRRPHTAGPANQKTAPKKTSRKRTSASGSPPKGSSGSRSATALAARGGRKQTGKSSVSGGRKKTSTAASGSRPARKQSRATGQSGPPRKKTKATKRKPGGRPATRKNRKR